MKATALFAPINTPILIARMEDGTYRWVADGGQLIAPGPTSAWVERGLSARAHDGRPSIQPVLLERTLLAQSNERTGRQK